MTAAGALTGRDGDFVRQGAFLPVVFVSLTFHITVFFIVPMLVRLLYRSAEFERPRTFQVISIPQSIQDRLRAADRARRPAERAKTPAPAKDPSVKMSDEPAPREQQAMNELSELLGGIAKPVSDVAAVSGTFKYPWYIQNIMTRVERNWTPPSGLSPNPDAAVVVSFTILADGAISEPAVTGSSGVPALDNLALRAIKMAAPFGKLPVGVSENRLELNYTLRVSKQ